jgi:flagellar basal body-associated protein FliL
MAESNTDATEKRSGKDLTAVEPKSGGMLLKVTALLFVVAVILAECLIAYLYLPSSEGTASASTPAPKQEHATAEKTEHAKAEPGKPAEKKEGKAEQGKKSEPEEEVDPSDEVEEDLEQFSVTAHQPTASTTMRVEFHLFGAVTAKDKDDFQRLLKLNHHRIREQILVIVRSAEPADLADARLGLIKRQILEKINALLGKPLLRAVVVSEFSYMEQ